MPSPLVLPCPAVRWRAALVAALVTVLMAGLLAAAAPASARPRTLAERRAANAVLTVLNAERAAHGLGALAPGSRLIVSARRHDLSMAARNALSHQLPGEPSTGRRISLAGYRWTRCAENIAWTSAMSTRGAILMQRLMYNEKAPNDGHRLNILGRSYRQVGVAVYMDSRHHKLWLTVDFGRH